MEVNHEPSHPQTPAKQRDWLMAPFRILFPVRSFSDCSAFRAHQRFDWFYADRIWSDFGFKKATTNAARQSTVGSLISEPEKEFRKETRADRSKGELAGVLTCKQDVRQCQRATFLVSLGGLGCHTVRGSVSFRQLSASLFKAPAAVSLPAVTLPWTSLSLCHPSVNHPRAWLTLFGSLWDVFSKIGARLNSQSQAICISDIKCPLAKRWAETCCENVSIRSLHAQYIANLSLHEWSCLNF